MATICYHQTNIHMNRFSLPALLVTAVLIFSCNHQKEEEESGIFTVTSPLQKDTVLYQEYVAQIRSSSHIELRSQEKGYLDKIFVDEGQFVRKGQMMFQIMPALYQAEVEKARAEMNFAQIEYNNTKSLSDKNVVSPNELALAKAKLSKAQAELSLAQTHLQFTQIRAPFDGYMDRFQKRLGSLIDEGELLTTLSDNSRMWVYFNVPEAEYLDYMHKGKPDSTRQVLLRMANKELFELPGRVETIEADFNNETGNIAFRATFPNPNGLLRHGETGNILMPVNLKGAVIIPQKATFDVLDRKYVYVVDEKGMLNTRPITVSRELPHLYIVASGIGPADKILAEGLGKVSNNQKIKFTFVPFDKEMQDLNNLHAE